MTSYEFDFDFVESGFRFRYGDAIEVRRASGRAYRLLFFFFFFLVRRDDSDSNVVVCVCLFCVCVLSFSSQIRVTQILKLDQPGDLSSSHRSVFSRGCRSCHSLPRGPLARSLGGPPALLVYSLPSMVGD